MGIFFARWIDKPRATGYRRYLHENNDKMLFTLIDGSSAPRDYITTIFAYISLRAARAAAEPHGHAYARRDEPLRRFFDSTFYASQ